MGAPRGRLLPALSLVALALPQWVGCGGASAPKSLPPQTIVEGSSQEEPPPPPPEPIEEPKRDETLIVLEPGTPETPGPSLVEAARAERARRAEATGSSLKLTDKNLDRYAVGELTTSAPTTITIEGSVAAEDPEAGSEDAAPVPAEEGAEAQSAGGDIETPVAETDEGYWRNRVLDIRLRWRTAADSIGELEGKAASLRNQFYATDDPYQRDSQVKPAWDRALIDLEQAKRDVERYQRELTGTLDEGRRAGALPGWLREGIEHEPEVADPPKSGESNYSVEPTIYQPDDRR